MDRSPGYVVPFCVLLERFLKSFIKNKGALIMELIKFIGAALFMIVIYFNMASYKEDTMAAM